jgi:hypothetical protein
MITLPTQRFIEAAGGYREVARRLREKPTTVHNWTRWERFPVAQYRALLALADDLGIERPSDDLFPFKEYPPADAEAGAA